VKLGSTDINRIGLGTNRLKDTKAHRAFVAQAVDAGINFIDTAHLYTGGESETAIGATLAPFPEEVVVATKGGFRDGRPENLMREIEDSLRRLRSETIDLYYLHRVDSEVPVERSVEAIVKAREDGKLRHIGLSEVGVEQIERARELTPIAAVQNRYSLSERSHDEVIDFCEREQILFVPFYPLGGRGGISGEAVEAIAAARGASAAQVALAWLLKRSPVVVPIPGSLSVEHVRDNLAALEIELSDQEFESLSRV
jgi:aryl-alcohol dehydrogenase-like predicted oxidoreductase